MSKNRWYVLIALCLLFAQSVCVLGFTVKEEIRLGAEAAREVEKQMPPSKNAQWQADIAALGQRFMPYLTRKESLLLQSS